ncbi:enhanced intracellular survival protein Eis [Alteribacillus sp. HJP-4]|uniref:GNAT family N-acetyltransferase n=1 Tax=Alteribacillus sp. HJP-4 TaxID=2775394 RepID=UPI0035CCDDEC
MELRKLKVEEIDEALELGQFAFQHTLTEDKIEVIRKQIKPEDIWVAVQNGQLFSKLHLLPVEVFAGGKKVKMCGVAGVATWPEARRGGIVRELLMASLLDMRERGCLFSFLYPFSVSFYRKFGWEMFADTYTWKMTKEQLPEKRGLKQGQIRRITKEEWQILQEVYEPFAKLFNGMIARDEEWWKQNTLIRKTGQIAVFSDSSGKDAGYLIYEIKNLKMKVFELVALHNEAKHQLWAFIANHDSMIEEAEIHTYAGDSYRFMLPDPKVKEENEGYFMARVVDVQKLLEEFPFSFKGEWELTLVIDDSFCDWNDGSFVLAFQDGRISIEPHKNKAVDGVRMSIQSLSALTLGYLNVSQAVDSGLITGEEESISQFSRLLPEQTPFIYDFF